MKHWRPDETAVPLAPARARREWTRLQAYWEAPGTKRRLPEGAKAGLVLVGAACVGVAIGIYQAFGPLEVIAPGAEAEWNAGPAETIVERQ